MKRILDRELVNDQCRWNKNGVCWDVYDEASPFVVNSRGALVHRVKALAKYMKARRHEHCDYWCGGGANDSGNLSYQDSVDSSQVLCARCEFMAVRSNRRKAEEISGHHVHIGGVKAIAYCCDIKTELKSHG